MQYAENTHIPLFFETSAMSGDNVEKVCLLTLSSMHDLWVTCVYNATYCIVGNFVGENVLQNLRIDSDL